MLNAIVLAGHQPVSNPNSIGNKALLKMNGKFMIEYVIDALEGVDEIDSIVVVGPGKELSPVVSEKVDAVVDSNGTIMQKLVKGIEYLGCNRHVLVCASDIPMITSEAVKDFIMKSYKTEADFCYPIIEKKSMDEKFPDAEKTFVKIKEGRFTGGNIFYINPLSIHKTIDLAEKLLAARKNPVKMASLLSLRFVLELLLGTLTIKKAEERFSKIMGLKARAIISQYAEIGNDVDKPGDIDTAANYLAK